MAGSTTRPPAHIVDALGILGHFCLGHPEATRPASTSKIFHDGWGAHAGIIAMDLASAGITGPVSVFEGKMGFFQTHLMPITGELDWKIPSEGIGSRWYLPETAYKPYPCCQLLHAFIEAAKQMLVDFAKDGISPTEIEHIMCKLTEPGKTLVTEPIDVKRRPTHPHAARFSLPYTVAAALLRGEVGMETFRPERLKDADVLALAQKVDWADDPESDYPLHCPAILEVKVRGKQYRKHIRFHPGSPEAALSKDDVLDKFHRNTSWLFGEGARELGASLAATKETESTRALFKKLESAMAGRKVGATA